MTVCTGNICRSPMAEVVLRDRFEAAGLGDAVVVDSSGVSDEEHGNPVDRRARAVLAEHGYPTGDGHRARRVTRDDVGSRDLILAMTTRHAQVLRNLAGSAQADPTIRMYRSFDPAADGAPEHQLDVADPWYGGPEDFEVCLTEIEAAADGVVDFVRAELGVPSGT
ncbi:low molecular weight protein-tyrosine-phosphatase [Promicromonospora sp. AC04]|uniref:low molecular weight protein-tyrosine-phosphatase n=1 Tax=Promicromonospora sp. AC04 TaxID=2135723 RepID=UPI000D3A0B81|nr:low molecular weight protein-tyrosine-phosphatase [Promicromonospora sp. AC04]